METKKIEMETKCRLTEMIKDIVNLWLIIEVNLFKDIFGAVVAVGRGANFGQLVVYLQVRRRAGVFKIRVM